MSKILLLLFILNPLIIQAKTDGLPTVSGVAVVCDKWIYRADAGIWGCLHTPRKVTLARGATTDEVLDHLYQRILKLEESNKELQTKLINE